MKQNHTVSHYSAVGYRTVELWGVLRTHGAEPLEQVVDCGISGKLSEDGATIECALVTAYKPRYWAPAMPVAVPPVPPEEPPPLSTRGERDKPSVPSSRALPPPTPETEGKIVAIDQEAGTFTVTLPAADGTLLYVRVIGCTP